MDASAEPIRRIDNPGIKAEGGLLHELRREVAGLLQRSQLGFPGAQPVSFARRHLQDLMTQDYYVCEKTDGIRYLLYLTQDEHGLETVYLIDRKNDFWFIHQRNLHFPKPQEEGEHHVKTIIDGELVMDRQPNGSERPQFLVFDCLMIDGMSLMERSLDKRLAYFKQNVYDPYRALFKKYPEELRFQAFQLVMKEQQLSYGMIKMFREVLPNLTHGNDGLIFTCRETPYKCGTDEHILKWKPVEDNTVDFKLQLYFPTVEPDDLDRAEGWNEPYVDYEGVPRAKLLIFAQGEVPAGQDPYQEFADLYLTEEEWEVLKGLGDPLVGRIVECYKDEEGRWRMYRFRDDKFHANHISVVDKVIESIQDPVSQQVLEDAGPMIRDKWKARQAGGSGGIRTCGFMEKFVINEAFCIFFFLFLWAKSVGWDFKRGWGIKSEDGVLWYEHLVGRGYLGAFKGKGGTGDCQWRCEPLLYTIIFGQLDCHVSLSSSSSSPPPSSLSMM